MLKAALSALAAICFCAGQAVAQEMPLEQREFLKIVDRARVGAKPDMPNEERMTILDLRGRWLCQKFRSPSVVDWLGTVWFAEKSRDGLGTLGIAIADGVSVETWASDTLTFMDVEKSMIAPNSALAKDVAGLKPGDKVRFSGRLFPTDLGDRCFESVAADSDLISPAFFMQFRSVQRTSEGPTITLPRRRAPEIAAAPQSAKAARKAAQTEKIQPPDTWTPKCREGTCIAMTLQLDWSRVEEIISVTVEVKTKLIGSTAIGFEPVGAVFLVDNGESVAADICTNDTCAVLPDTEKGRRLLAQMKAGTKLHTAYLTKSGRKVGPFTMTLIGFSATLREAERMLATSQ